MKTPIAWRQAQAGLALFEILVAMMVLSMSFLGTALLLAKTAKEERSAYFMGRAASLASDMAERIRSSPAALSHYVLDQSYETGSGEISAPSCGGLFTAPGASPADQPACSSAEGAAAYDLASWQVQVKSNLPAGVGSISVGTLSNARTIVLGWHEPAVDTVGGKPAAVNAGCPATFKAPETVRCYVMEVRP